MAQVANRFAALNEDDEDAAPPVVVKEKKDVTKKDTHTKAGDAQGPKGSSSGSRNADGGNKRAPKREYDRRSGTGRGRGADGAEDKRGGSGKYNWGKDGSGTKPEDETEGTDSPAKDGDKDGDAEEEKKEEAKLSLEEWKKQQEAVRESLEQVKVREVEKVDPTKEGFKAVEKNEENELDFGGEGKKNKSGSKKGGRTMDMVTDLGFRTPPVETGPPRDDRRRDSGGRGRGGRGGGGRGGGRGRDGGRGGGSGPRQTGMDLADANAFPAL